MGPFGLDEETGGVDPGRVGDGQHDLAAVGPGGERGDRVRQPGVVVLSAGGHPGGQREHDERGDGPGRDQQPGRAEGERLADPGRDDEQRQQRSRPVKVGDVVLVQVVDTGRGVGQDRHRRHRVDAEQHEQESAQPAAAEPQGHRDSGPIHQQHREQQHPHPGVPVRPPEPQRVAHDLAGAVTAGLRRIAVGEVLAEVTRPVQHQVHHDRQREQGADGDHRDPRPAPAGEAPQRRHRGTPVRPGQREHGSRGDDRDDEQEAGVPVDEEPAGEREDPQVPEVASRDGRACDQEHAVHGHVQVRHPVGVDRGRVHGAEDEDDREARGGGPQRTRPAIDDEHGQGQDRAVEHEDREQVRVPGGRHEMQAVEEDPLPEGLHVHVGRPRVVEVLPGVVADQQREVHRLLDQDRVRAGVTLLVELLAEQEPAARTEHAEQDSERDGPDPPGPARHRGDRRDPGRSLRALSARRRRRFPVPADAHCGFPGISGSRFRFHTITV